ncbi:MAG: lysine--tRNA ligase [Alphaproteobacteria bacterium]|nr:lysine--tRNA ligase [Alphaproteobacteria bacterium]
MSAILPEAGQATAWSFVEARRLLERFAAAPPAKGHVLFETGYGPSGLPHIGTFGEVARTAMVRRAFQALSPLPTRLVAFSDDLDGLRGVPDNLPEQEMLRGHLGRPLTAIPDPFGTAASFGHNMNGRLCAFLDAFGFEYQFLSATECYRAGRFDPTLLAVLEHFEAIMAIMLPTLGKDRQESFSPILPISPRSGRVLQVPIEERRTSAGTVVFRDEDGALTEVPVTGGHCKLGWKTDWAMRWRALAVDYEMYGKDLIESAKLSGRICRVLGGLPPEGFSYELFLDEQGHKISKSKGNGLTIDEWLRYGSPESLGLFMFNAPRKAKRLYFDVIPRQVDDYAGWLEKYPAQTAGMRLDNPVWHVHGGAPPPAAQPLGYNILLNLASVCNTEDKAVLWGFISRYVDATPESAPALDRLVGYAINYYRDFVQPTKVYRPPTETERAALADLADTLDRLPAAAAAEAIQFEVYEVGKRHGFTELRAWFKALYETLLGQSEGPRMGTFIALYGKEATVALIRRVLRGEPIGHAA